MKIKLINYGYENLPFRAHYNDAGADVHACLKDRKVMTVLPHETKKVPLGFGLIIPDGMMGLVFPRSGLSSNGIVCELPPIDSGYRGEIHAIVTNHTDEPYTIIHGDRIGQLVIIPIIIPEFVNTIDRSRGDRGFGSTGI